MTNKRKLSDLALDSGNANKGTERGRQAIEASIREFGFADAGTLDKHNTIIGGNKRTLAAGVIGMDEAIIIDVDGTQPVYIRRNDLDLSSTEDDRARRLAYALNRSQQLSLDWDTEQLMADLNAGFDLSALWRQDELDELLADLQPKGTEGDTEPQVDRAEELRQKWQVETGQMWQLGGEHRLICGDCTDAAVVKRVMGGEKAVVCHADPPYGMGKEAEGIANDNLYRERLDTFQMQWWKACRPSIEDNGSVYIWGTAEDLWRLWYMGGLKNSERLTLRNEIVWNKGSAQGMNSDQHRMYPTASERALFFMLGEQGFNNNADNYWDGWEPIRAYLKEQRDLMGWDNAKCKTLAGHSPSSGCHWFDASQWIFVTKDAYTAWQAAAKGAGFKRDYDELKRDFYATRAYFDNAHASMTDVWDFPGVTGDERHGHATPKPVAMMARAIKSSSPDGAIVYAPFNGTGPELIACENLGRRCRAVEISPGYVAVALERFHQHSGKLPVLITGE